MGNDSDTSIQDELDIYRSLAGDAEAFGRLILRNFSRVRAISFARLRDPESADELTQEVFLRAYLGLADLRQPRHFLAWCARIARNLAADWVRSHRSTSRLLTMISLDELPVDVTRDEAPSPREQLEIREQQQLLWKAILNLPVTLREVVLLHYSEGLNKAEIARTLRINRSSAGRQLGRALELLRQHMGATPSGSWKSDAAKSRAITRTVMLVAAVATMPASQRSALAAAAIRSGHGSLVAYPRLRERLACRLRLVAAPSRKAALPSIALTIIVLAASFAPRHPRSAQSPAPSPAPLYPRSHRSAAAPPSHRVPVASSPAREPVPPALPHLSTAANANSTAGVVQVSGRVTLENEKIASGATVRLLEAGLEVDIDNFSFDMLKPVASARADSSGQYLLTFRPSPAAKGYGLAAGLPGYTTNFDGLPDQDAASHSYRVGNAGTGAQPPVLRKYFRDFSLSEAPASIDGVVIDHKGAPVANAVVAATKDEYHTIWPVQVHTNSEGRFLLHGLPVGNSLLHVSSGGLVPIRTILAAPASGVVVKLEPVAAELSGIVRLLDGHEPVANATVTLHPADTSASLARIGAPQNLQATTDADGAYFFEKLPPGAYRISARSGALYSALLSGHVPPVLEIADKESTRVADLLLYPGHTVIGIARESLTSAPLPGAEVVVTYARRKRSVLTAEDGSYRIDGVYNSDLSVDVAKPGYKLIPTLPAVTFALAADQPVLTYDFQMARTETVSGTVLDEGGKPVSGAEVVLIGQPVSNASRTTTDMDGNYTVETPPDSSFQLSAHLGKSQSAFHYLRAARQPLTDITLKLETNGPGGAR